MKILFVQTNVYSNNASGVPRVTYNLGKYFTENGLDVGYFSFKTEGHVDVKYGKLYIAKENGSIGSKKNLQALQNAIGDFKPDCVINQMPYKRPLRKLLYKLKASHNFKLFGCIHASLFSFKNNVKAIMKRELVKPFNNIMSTNITSKVPLFYHNLKQKVELTDMLNIHDTLLLYTPANYEELRFFLPNTDLVDKKIDYMKNPVYKIQSKVPKKEKIILHLGRINVPQKRSDLLLDFWENTYKHLPDWQFKVVGNGDYYETLISELKKRKLPRIELLGFQIAEPYYKEASIFMMPSAYEGIPHTIIDSQSFGCPTLAFNSYAALEHIVENGKNALLAKPFDTKEMAKLCVDLASNKYKLKQMQESALQNAKQFSIEIIGKKWIDLFKKS
jgi:glycosyltransferase involved in cell wall biosynthesis